LVLHEIAHSGCSHIRYYEDDHHSDFKEMTDILREIDANLTGEPIIGDI